MARLTRQTKEPDISIEDRLKDEHGFLDPECAAAHVLLIQGGFTTPHIEAQRMIRDGGVAKERAETWIANNPGRTVLTNGR